MTDKKIRGQNFNHFYYADDEGNTTEVKFSTDVHWKGMLELIADGMDEVYNREFCKGKQGNWKVTIEFHPEDEVEDG